MSASFDEQQNKEEWNTKPSHELNPPATVNNRLEQKLNVTRQVANEKDKGTTLKAKMLALGAWGIALVVLGGIAQSFFPWWSIAVVAFIIGFLCKQTAAGSFTLGLIAVSLLWMAYAGWQNVSNNHLMSSAMSNIFAGKMSATQLMWATGLLGGLVGGNAAMTGALLKGLLKK